MEEIDMNSKIKKNIAREGLIIAGIGIPALSCYILAQVLHPYSLKEICILASYILITCYMGLWFIRIFKWLVVASLGMYNYEWFRRKYLSIKELSMRQIFIAFFSMIILLILTFIFIPLLGKWSASSIGR